MMKMDGRDSAECQNWEKKDIDGIIGFDLNDNNAKILNSIISFKLNQTPKVGENQKIDSEPFFGFLRERSSFSLSFRQIRPSAVFGTRRKVALRGEGFAWVPDLGSFLKFREVGVSPYLGFIPSLSTLSMFELNETVRGRLIGPKT